MKKIALIAHEFGLFRGRGGIATYLYHLSRGLLETFSDIEVYVFAFSLDAKSDLLKDERFHLTKVIGNTISEKGYFVLENLKRVKPDIVEVADAFALAYEAMVYKKFSLGKELDDTKFYIINHTATRECYEWSYQVPLKFASRDDIGLFNREKTSMSLCDCNIYPAEFLKNYCRKNYGVVENRTKILRYTYCGMPLDKYKLKAKYEKIFDLADYENTFNITYLSRFEKRKNQKLLVEEFVDFLRLSGAKANLFLIGNSIPDKLSGIDTRMLVFEKIPEEYREHIHFYDFADKKKIEQLSVVSDITVMTSTFENFPFAMIENSLRKVPILTSKYNGCCDYMGKYREITSFDPYIEHDLRDKLLYLYKNKQTILGEIEEIQFNNLKEMVDEKKSIGRKMDFYLNYNCIDDYSKIEYEVITDFDLETLVKPICKDWVLVCHDREREIIGKGIEIYRNILNRLKEKYIVVFYVGENHDLNIEESLLNNRNFMINKPENGSENKKNLEYIASMLKDDGRKVLYLPIPTKEWLALERKDRKFKPYNSIWAELFRLKNEINMEDKYE